jgi:hypothetical protein
MCGTIPWQLCAYLINTSDTSIRTNKWQKNSLAQKQEMVPEVHLPLIFLPSMTATMYWAYLLFSLLSDFLFVGLITGLMTVGLPVFNIMCSASSYGLLVPSPGTILTFSMSLNL